MKPLPIRELLMMTGDDPRLPDSLYMSRATIHLYAEAAKKVGFKSKPAALDKVDVSKLPKGEVPIYDSGHSLPIGIVAAYKGDTLVALYQC